MLPLTTSLQEKLAELRQFQEDFYTFSQHELAKVVGTSSSLQHEDLVDMGFLLRELETMGEEIRKEAKKRKDLCGKLVSFRVITKSVEDGSTDIPNIHGQLASGKIVMKMQPVLPKKGTAEHSALLKYLKVDEESVERGLVKPDWTQMGLHCTELVAMGKPLPPGVGQTFPDYNVSYTKKRTAVDREDPFPIAADSAE